MDLGRIQLDVQYTKEPGYQTRVRFKATFNSVEGTITEFGDTLDEALHNLSVEIIRDARD